MNLTRNQIHERLGSLFGEIKDDPEGYLIGFAVTGQERWGVAR